MSINKNFWENESNEAKRHKENTEMKQSIRLADNRCPHCGSKDVETADPPPIAIESTTKTGVPYKYSYMKCKNKKCGRPYQIKLDD